MEVKEKALTPARSKLFQSYCCTNWNQRIKGQEKLLLYTDIASDTEQDVRNAKATQAVLAQHKTFNNFGFVLVRDIFF